MQALVTEAFEGGCTTAIPTDMRFREQVLTNSSPHALLPPFSFSPPVSWAASPTTWLSTFKDSCYVSWLKGDPGCLESAEESAHPHCLWTCFAVRLSSLRAFYVGLASRVGSLNPPHVKWMTVQSPGRPSCVSLRWLWWQWPGPVWRSC